MLKMITWLFVWLLRWPLVPHLRPFVVYADAKRDLIYVIVTQGQRHAPVAARGHWYPPSALTFLLALGSSFVL